ncbi:uncharacterized protein LOC119167167 isoform X4 [Rhipicephalus microplus]|uniref:uncharacterized protein LOC119167167 isoform X4 n=1 Tax=Rhipicephalus microplus TaxID=6941 RepID=UPI003F6CEA77
MGVLFQCHALVMCLTIVSSLTSNSVQHQNGDNTDSSRGIGKQDTNESGLTFGLPHPGPVSWRHPTKPPEINNDSLTAKRQNGPIISYAQKNTTKLAEKPLQLICSPKPTHGRCNVSEESWHFDSATATCMRYSPRTCPNGSNKFRSCEKCMKTCTNLKAKESCRILMEY